MSTTRPKSSHSDAHSFSEPPQQLQGGDKQPFKSSIKKASGLVPPKTKVPKSFDGSYVSVGSDKAKEDSSSQASQQRPSSRSQETKTPRNNNNLRTTSMISYSSNQKRVLENQFTQKKLRFLSLKREIEDKQRSSDSAYEELYQLREKILINGGKDPGKIEDLFGSPISSVKGKSGDDADVDNLSADDKDFVVKVQKSFKNLPESTLAFCKEVMEKRNETTTWMIEMERKIDECPPKSLKEELVQHLEQFRIETSDYLERFASMQKDVLHQTSDLMQRISCMCQELRMLKQKHEQFREEGGDVLDSQAQAINSEELEEISKELKNEKEKVLKARAKIREQKSYIAQTEEKLQLEIDKVKKLEAQLKQKESVYGQKAKELSKHSKSHEAVINKLEKQKETLEARVSKLKEELEFMEAENKAAVSQYEKQLEHLNHELDLEKKSKAELRAQLDEFMVRYAKLEENCKQLLEGHVEQDKQEIPDENHTENELQLFNELKDTQKLLAEKDEIIQRLEVEREEIITAVNEAGQENDSSTKKLTAELLKKSNELHSVKSQFAQLQKNYKRLQHKSDQMELKFEEINKLQSQMKDGSRASYGAQILQLQQQVSDQRNNLSEATSQINEYEKTITQLQMKIDHYKRYIRDIGKDYKLKKEMYQILGNKDVAEPIDPKNLTKINDEFEKLYGAVESKDNQIKKLEKIIIQMEKHEEYSQAQRTRLEQRIGKLETALKEGQQAHRYVESSSCGHQSRPTHHRQQAAAVSYDFEAYLDPQSPTHAEVARCNACPGYVKARVAAYSSSGCSSDLVRRTPSYERAHKQSARRNAKRATLPVPKWFLKPFYRESSNHVVYNRHLKNIGIVRGEGEQYHRSRHHDRKVRVTNLRSTAAHSYDAPTVRYYD